MWSITGINLGPNVFWSIYYIFNVFPDIKYILHAGDTSILCSSNNIKKLCNAMNKNLEELQTWFIVNKLSLGIEEKKLHDIL